jgi:hypothetical protein
MKAHLHHFVEVLLRRAASRSKNAPLPGFAYLLPLVLGASSRPGALILGAKSIERVREILASIGRAEEVMALTADSFYVAPFRDFERDSCAVATWLEAHSPLTLHNPLALRLLSCACILARMDGLGRVESVQAVVEGVATIQELSRSTGSRYTGSAISDARESFSAAVNQGVLEPWEAASIERFLQSGMQPYSHLLEAATCVHLVLSPWLEGTAFGLLTDRSRPEFLVEQLWHAGVIAVADGSLPQTVERLLAESFEYCLTSRAERVFFDGRNAEPINQSRPAFLFRSPAP